MVCDCVDYRLCCPGIRWRQSFAGFGYPQARDIADSGGAVRRVVLLRQKAWPAPKIWSVQAPDRFGPDAVLCAADPAADGESVVWRGPNQPPLETVLYVLSMFCVGFLEELIFRGLLFQAMAKDGVRSAVVVSSVTFGIGHIVNLFNGSGAELLPNLLQVVYAVAVGFAFVMIFCRTKSLVPCIITHSVFNGLSAFAKVAAETMQRQVISGVLLAVIAGGYAWYLALNNEEDCHEPF